MKIEEIKQLLKAMYREAECKHAHHSVYATNADIEALTLEKIVHTTKQDLKMIEHQKLIQGPE